MRRFILSLVIAGCGEQTVELFDACACSDAGVTLSSRDPEACGAALVHCEDDQYCVDGACVCRPSLLAAGEDCIDPSTDGDRCGEPPVDCPSFCVEGACGASCPAPLFACESGCVDLASHPLHCGECGRPCGANQICLSGICTEFRPCASCPCEACAECTTYPMRPDPICLER